MQLELIDTWRLMLLPAEPQVKYYSYQTFLLFVDSLSYENFSRLKTFQNLDYNPKMFKELLIHRANSITGITRFLSILHWINTF